MSDIQQENEAAVDRCAETVVKHKAEKRANNWNGKIHMKSRVLYG